MIRDKKWWWPLLENVVNAAVVAGWRLYCQIFGSKALSHLEFCRQITLNLIKSPLPPRLLFRTFDLPANYFYECSQLGGRPHGSLPVTVQYDGSIMFGYHAIMADVKFAWDSGKGSTKKTEFILTDAGKMCFTEQKGGCYHHNRKNPSSVLVPQPSASEVHALKQYYATLKRDNTYKNVFHG